MNYLFILFYSVLCSLGITTSDSQLSLEEVKSLTYENRDAIIEYDNQFQDPFNDEEWR